MVDYSQLTGAGVVSLRDRFKENGDLNKFDAITIVRLLFRVPTDKYGAVSVIGINSGIQNALGDKSITLARMLTNKFRLGELWRFHTDFGVVVVLRKIAHESGNSINLALQYKGTNIDENGNKSAVNIERPLIEYNAREIKQFGIDKIIKTPINTPEDPMGFRYTISDANSVKQPEAETAESDVSNQEMHEPSVESVADDSITAHDVETNEGEIPAENESAGSDDSSGITTETEMTSVDDLDEEDEPVETRSENLDEENSTEDSDTETTPEDSAVNTTDESASSTEEEPPSASSLMDPIDDDTSEEDEATSEPQLKDNETYLNGVVYEYVADPMTYDFKETDRIFFYVSANKDPIALCDAQGNPIIPGNEAAKKAVFTDNPGGVYVTHGNDPVELTECDESEEATADAPTNEIADNPEATISVEVEDKPVVPTDIKNDAQPIDQEEEMNQDEANELEEQMNTNKETEPVKTDYIDLSDPEVRNNLLIGMLGNANPSMNHLRSYLNDYHYENKTESFLATKSWPTETDVIYDNLTFAIVKMYNGKLYRIYCAHTDMSLDDPSWIHTNRTSDRWTQLGSDIHDNQSFDRGYRNGYRR